MSRIARYLRSPITLLGLGAAALAGLALAVNAQYVRSVQFAQPSCVAEPVTRPAVVFGSPQAEPSTFLPQVPAPAQFALPQVDPLAPVPRLTRSVAFTPPQAMHPAPPPLPTIPMVEQALAPVPPPAPPPLAPVALLLFQELPLERAPSGEPLAVLGFQPVSPPLEFHDVPAARQGTVVLPGLEAPVPDVTPSALPRRPD